jgi:hypothetical protein
MHRPARPSKAIGLAGMRLVCSPSLPGTAPSQPRTVSPPVGLLIFWSRAAACSLRRRTPKKESSSAGSAIVSACPFLDVESVSGVRASFFFFACLGFRDRSSHGMPRPVGFKIGVHKRQIGDRGRRKQAKWAAASAHTGRGTGGDGGEERVRRAAGAQCGRAAAAAVDAIVTQPVPLSTVSYVAYQQWVGWRAMDR